MHQLLHDAATAFVYFGAFTMAVVFLYVIVWLPFIGSPDNDDY